MNVAMQGVLDAVKVGDIVPTAAFQKCCSHLTNGTQKKKLCQNMRKNHEEHEEEALRGS